MENLNDLVFTFGFLIALVTFLNHRKLKKRVDTLEIVLAKKNILAWDDPAWKLNEDDQKLLKDLNN